MRGRTKSSKNRRLRRPEVRWTNKAVSESLTQRHGTGRTGIAKSKDRTGEGPLKTIRALKTYIKSPFKSTGQTPPLLFCFFLDTFTSKGQHNHNCSAPPLPVCQFARRPTRGKKPHIFCCAFCRQSFVPLMPLNDRVTQRQDENWNDDSLD